MFKQFKTAKVLALLTVTMGALYAPPGSGDADGQAPAAFLPMVHYLLIVHMMVLANLQAQ